MKYISFTRPDGSVAFGRLKEDTVYDLSQGAPDLKAAIAAGSLPSLQDGEAYSLDSVGLLPVIPNPAKIFCVGHNYESHRQETGRAKVDNPSIFTRFSDTLLAHGEKILRPKVSTDLDYEGELAVIIGWTRDQRSQGHGSCGRLRMF